MIDLIDYKIWFQNNFNKVFSIIYSITTYDDEFTSEELDGLCVEIYLNDGQWHTEAVLKEDKCKCGTDIPMGYGYYNYGKELKCFGCGKVNRKSIRSHNNH